jgi:hypothetical protein
VLQPRQVLAVAAGDASGQLDFDGHDAAVGALDDEVNLLAPARGPKMPDLGLAVRGVDAHRQRHEALEQRAEQRAVTSNSRVRTTSDRLKGSNAAGCKGVLRQHQGALCASV